MAKNNQKLFYGTTTLGEKGQVVIPAEARKRMDIRKGEKLLVFGNSRDMLTMFKLANLEKVALHLSKGLKAIRKMIKRTNAK